MNLTVTVLKIVNHEGKIGLSTSPQSRTYLEKNQSAVEVNQSYLRYDWLTSTAYQPVKGYFMPRG